MQLCHGKHSYLMPEDPERAGHDDCSGDDDVNDELTRDDRVFSLAWRLLQHVVVDRLHTEAARQTSSTITQYSNNTSEFSQEALLD